jgi:hypothetical protein
MTELLAGWNQPGPPAVPTGEQVWLIGSQWWCLMAGGCSRTSFTCHSAYEF